MTTAECEKLIKKYDFQFQMIYLLLHTYIHIKPNIIDLIRFSKVPDTEKCKGSHPHPNYGLRSVLQKDKTLQSTSSKRVRCTPHVLTSMPCTSVPENIGRYQELIKKVTQKKDTYTSQRGPLVHHP